jgi:hypothetical protein
VILLAICAVLLAATTGYSQTRVAGAGTGGKVAPGEWLSLCAKCASPRLTAASGIGTANARAEAHLTREDVLTTDGPCNGSTDKACVQKETARPYRASADCTAGRITTILDESFTLAGIWDNSDIGGGRTKWKGADGQIVGRDNASNGLAVSQQWEVLCPGPVTQALLARAAAPAPTQLARGGAAAVNAAQARTAATAQTASLCAGQRYCDEVGSFVATITDVRTSNYQNTTRVLSVTVRFQNKLNRPLILGFVPGSAIAIDEQGNRYTIAAAANVRGIGDISNAFDPKFNIGPGQAGDTRFELTWRIDSRAIIGERSWDLDLSVREVNEIGPGQYRFGSEHALQFKGLQNQALTSAAPGGAAPGAALPTVSGGARPGTAPPATAPVAAAPVPTAPSTDGCAGKPRCYDAGPFIAEIVNASSSFVNRSGRWHTVALNIRFTNRSAEPINLGYMVGTAVMLDNFGNRYVVSAAPEDIRGMGKVTGNAADPQFLLRPGESRAATFGQARLTQANQPLGTAFTFDTTIAHLKVLYNGQQIRTEREYTMTFPDFGLNAPGAATSATPASGTPPPSIQDTADKLRGLFGGKKK